MPLFETFGNSHESHAMPFQMKKFKRKKKNGGVMRRMKDKLSCLAPPRNKKKNMLDIPGPIPLPVVGRYLGS